MTDPWDDCIYTYTFTIRIIHSCIGKYTVRPMDPMGYGQTNFFNQCVAPEVRAFTCISYQQMNHSLEIGYDLG